MVSIIGASGRPGESVAISLSLDQDWLRSAVAIDVEVRFDSKVLTFAEPLLEHCVIAPRIATTHAIAGQRLAENMLLISIFSNTATHLVEPLGNGPLASCTAEIATAATAGATALTAARVDLSDAQGERLTVTSLPGAVEIVGPPTGTPSVQASPTTEEPTAAPTITATATPPSAPRTPTVGRSTCTGDCDGDHTVSVSELIDGVRISLGQLGVEHCAAVDRDGNGQVMVDELIAAVQAALTGCR